MIYHTCTYLYIFGNVGVDEQLVVCKLDSCNRIDVACNCWKHQ